DRQRTKRHRRGRGYAHAHEHGRERAPPLIFEPKQESVTARPVHRGCAYSRPWMAGGRPWEQDADRPGEHTPCVTDGSADQNGAAADVTTRSNCHVSTPEPRQEPATPPGRPYVSPSLGRRTHFCGVRTQASR